MKQLLLALLIVPVLAYSQLYYKNGVTAVESGTTGSLTDLKIHFKNNSGALIRSLNWKVIKSEYPSEWGAWTICDNINCYFQSGIEDSTNVQTMVDLDTTDNELNMMKLSVFPETLGDTMEVQLLMYTSDSSVWDTLTFRMVDVINSIQETKEIVSMYPNPAQSHIQLNVKERSQLTIYSVLGNVVLSETLQPGNNRVDLSSLISGQYFVAVENDGNTTIERLMKR